MRSAPYVATAAVLAAILLLGGCATLKRRGPPDLEAGAKAAYAQAEACVGAFVAAEFDVFVACAHPSVIEMMGGPAEARAYLESELKNMEDQGFSLESMTLREPDDLIATDESLYAILEGRVLMGSPFGRLAMETFMLGVSEDGGVSWRFVDGSGLNPETMNAIFPDFPDDVRLPRIGTPRPAR